MRLAGRGLVLALGLAGCGAAELPSVVAPSNAQFSPDGNGLGVAGTGQRIDFGRAPSGVIAVLDRELGRGKALGLDGCPAEITDQRDWSGLVLTFTVERFVGWRNATGRAGQTCS